MDRSTFEDASLSWQELTPHTQINIPKEFSITVVTDYLSKLPVYLVSGTCYEEVDAGTRKPAVKGRQMYVSK